MNDTQTFTQTIRQIIRDLERLDRRLLALPDMLIEDTDDDSLGDIDYPTTEEDDGIEEDRWSGMDYIVETDEEEDIEEEDIEEDDTDEEDEEIDMDEEPEIEEDIDEFNNRNNVDKDVLIRTTDRMITMEDIDRLDINDSSKYFLRCIRVIGNPFTRNTLQAVGRVEDV